MVSPGREKAVLSPKLRSCVFSSWFSDMWVNEGEFFQHVYVMRKMKVCDRNLRSLSARTLCAGTGRRGLQEMTMYKRGGCVSGLHTQMQETSGNALVFLLW